MQKQKQIEVYNAGDKVMIRNAASFCGVVAGEYGIVVDASETYVRFKVEKDNQLILNQTRNPSFTLLKCE